MTPKRARELAENYADRAVALDAELRQCSPRDLAALRAELVELGLQLVCQVVIECDPERTPVSDLLADTVPPPSSGYPAPAGSFSDEPVTRPSRRPRR